MDLPSTKSSMPQPSNVAASALKATQARMRVIAENIANANSTGKTPGADPYRRQIPVFQATQVDGGLGVTLAQVRPDPTDFKQEYDPGNPAADAKGFVKRPNVDPLIEMMDMRDAQKAYEANLNVIETTRSMDNLTLGIIKK